MKLRKDLAGRTRSALLLAAAVAGLSTAALAPTAWAAPVAQDEFGVLFNCGTYPENQAVSRSQALARAQTWLDVKVPYSQSNCHSNLYGSYRTDCSGFVSMAWGLRRSYTTRDIQDVSHENPRADLRPGDALNDYNSHMALFVRWADAAHTRPVVREQASSSNGTIERTWTQAYASGDTPIRYDKIVEDTTQPASGPMYHQIRNAAGTGWSGFQPLAGMGTSEHGHARDMSIAAMPDGSAQVLIVGADGKVYHQIRRANGGWTGFLPLAGMGTTEPAGGKRVSIAAMPDGSAQVLIVGADGRVYHQIRNAAGTAWTGFLPLNGMGTTEPAGAKDVAITGTPDGAAQVLIVGFDDRVYHQVRLANGSGWTGFLRLAGMGTADPAAGSQVSIAGMPDNSAQVTIVGR